MRSRYSAFAVGEHGYLLATWHPDARPREIESDEREWLGLQVMSKTRGGLFDVEGTVEYIAHYRDGGRRGNQRETSRFVREAGRWFYLGPA